VNLIEMLLCLFILTGMIFSMIAIQSEVKHPGSTGYLIFVAGVFLATFIISVISGAIISALLRVSDKVKETDTYQDASCALEDVLIVYLLPVLAQHPGDTIRIHFSGNRVVAAVDETYRPIKLTKEEEKKVLKATRSLMRKRLGFVKGLALKCDSIGILIPPPSNHQIMNSIARAARSAAA